MSTASARAFGDQLGAGVAGDLLELVGHPTHPADRHLPLAGAAADHVVGEADVLLQRGVVRTGERADQCVGEDDAADDVVGQRRLDQVPDRVSGQGVPDLVVAEGGPQG